MSTTKRYTGPIVPGMKCWPGMAARDRGDEPWVVHSFVAGDPYPVKYTRNPDSGDYEETFRTERILVDAPAEKRELNRGWQINTAQSHKCYQFKRGYAHVADFARDGKRLGHGDVKVVDLPPAAYANGNDGACEACAPSMGVFAPPAPAKTCKPWCGKCYGDCSVPCMLTMGMAVFFDGKLATSKPAYCSAACRDAARAKPAEPKPAPTLEEMKRMAAKAREEMLAKPAPAEKAKREWRAPKEMEGGVFRPALARGLVAAMEGRDERNGHSVRLDLEGKRSINVRGVRPIYLPPTESQGEKLARLVESGLRADVRQGETRFEAGLRGRR